MGTLPALREIGLDLVPLTARMRRPRLPAVAVGILVVRVRTLRVDIGPRVVVPLPVGVLQRGVHRFADSVARGAAGYRADGCTDHSADRTPSNRSGRSTRHCPACCADASPDWMRTVRARDGVRIDVLCNLFLFLFLFVHGGHLRTPFLARRLGRHCTSATSITRARAYSSDPHRKAHLLPG